MKKAFTLIEILVVVAIIGVLAALIFVGYSEAQKKSRDSKRIADFDLLRGAINLYKMDAKIFPINPCTAADNPFCQVPYDSTAETNNNNNDYNNGSGVLSELVSGGYINNLPKDPSPNGRPVYYYWPTSKLNPTVAYLVARLENYSSTEGYGGSYRTSPGLATDGDGNWYCTKDTANGNYCLRFE